MKLFHVGKDGGPDSTVTGYWLVEIKHLLSIAFLRFDNGTRDSYHNHAFDSLSWILSGKLNESHLGGSVVNHVPGLRPVITRRKTFHRVFSVGKTWVFTLRGPWAKQWREYNPYTRKYSTLEDGRVVASTGEA